VSSHVNYDPYDPLDTVNIADSLATRLTEQQPLPLASVPRFLGAGSYAIYYTGGFPTYEPLTQRDSSGYPFRPIYIGKADPKGKRTAGQGSNSTATLNPLEYEPSTELHNRLRKHANSIEAASNLDLEDFWCRYLVITPIFAALGESVLISRFMPVWNVAIDGFGNHDPGKGRYGGLVPKWDVLHPGRAWAARCQPRRETPEQIAKEARQYINERL